MKRFGIGARVEATFAPYRTEDLRPELRPFVGARVEFSYAWAMDEDDPFPGEVAWTCAEFPYWVPERDLASVSIKTRGYLGPPLHETRGSYSLRYMKRDGWRRCPAPFEMSDFKAQWYWRSLGGLDGEYAIEARGWRRPFGPVKVSLVVTPDLLAAQSDPAGFLARYIKREIDDYIVRAQSKEVEA